MQENILKKIINLFFIVFFLCLTSSFNSYAKEKWVLDKNISSIKFEVPVLFATNVIGEFQNFDGFVELDLNNRINNKAILSVDIKSLKINYKKYIELILGPIFFDTFRYPLAVLDTKKFSYNDENELKLNIELNIKGISKNIETKLNIIKLSSDLVQILGTLEFSRNDFNIGTGSWNNTTILKDIIKIKTNLFLIKE
mgnify:CR=1 FL=1